LRDPPPGDVFGSFPKEKKEEKDKAIIEATLASAEVSAGAVAKADQNPVKLGTLSQLACHPPLPTEVGTHMRQTFRWPSPSHTPTSKEY
jgi:hypothetical protein